MFETLIEPATGFMIQHRKKATVFVNFKEAQTLPFPSLDAMGKQLVPLYDLTETLSIDSTQVKFHLLTYSNSIWAAMTSLSRRFRLVDS